MFNTTKPNGVRLLTLSTQRVVTFADLRPKVSGLLWEGSFGAVQLAENVVQYGGLCKLSQYLSVVQTQVIDIATKT